MSKVQLSALLAAPGPVLSRKRRLRGRQPHFAALDETLGTNVNVGRVRHRVMCRLATGTPGRCPAICRRNLLVLILALLMVAQHVDGQSACGGIS